MVKFYNKRGTVEQWIKEGKYALKWTRLWRHDFVDNQVRLQLFAMAYNLGNFLRRLALPKRVMEWSLRTLRVKLIKIGDKVVKFVFLLLLWLKYFQNEAGTLSFQDRFDILLEKRLNGASELRYIMVYGKSQFVNF